MNSRFIKPIVFFGNGCSRGELVRFGEIPPKDGTTNTPAYMACGAKGVYGRAKGTVRSKAEPWNERCVKNVSLGTKCDFRLKAVLQALNPREFSVAMKMALIAI